MMRQKPYVSYKSTRLSETMPALSMLSIGVGLLVITTGHSIEGFGAVVLGVGIGLALPISRLLAQSIAVTRRRGR